MSAPGLQKPGSPEPITMTKLLVVEGKSPFQFFKACLRELGLLGSIEIRDAGGITEFAPYLQVLKLTSGFSNVRSVAVVRDAEVDANSAFQSVASALSAAGLPVPTAPRSRAQGDGVAVVVYILPDCSRPGMLETLCWEALRSHPGTSCVESYLDCLAGKGFLAPTDLKTAKVRVNSFLAFQKQPEWLLGQAAHAGVWDWGNPVFADLLAFLRSV